MAAYGGEKQQSGHALHVVISRGAAPGPGDMLSEALLPIPTGATDGLVLLKDATCGSFYGIGVHPRGSRLKRAQGLVSLLPHQWS